MDLLFSLCSTLNFESVMYAVVEFLNSELESSGEVSIVPFIWIHKNDTKCYWPIRTNRIPFNQFVKDQAPFKKSWPSYRIKIHFKSSKYFIY